MHRRRAGGYPTWLASSFSLKDAPGDVRRQAGLLGFFEVAALKGPPGDWSIRRLNSWRRATREDRDAIRPQCRAAHTIEEKGLLRPGGPASRLALLLSL